MVYAGEERIKEAQELLSMWEKDPQPYDAQFPSPCSYSVFFEFDKPRFVLINYAQNGEIRSQTLDLTGAILDAPRDQSVVNYHKTIQQQWSMDIRQPVKLRHMLLEGRL